MNRTEHSIASGDDDIRVDRWFKRHYPGLLHALLEKQLRKGSIRVDGLKVKSSDRLRFGQTIEIRFDISKIEQSKTPAVRRPLLPEDEKMMKDAVLYRDERVIILNKPAGIPTQGGSNIKRSIDDLLDALTFEGERPKLTHRLDRDTSGCLVLARTRNAATSLMKLFSARQVDKTYWAIIDGVPGMLQGIIDSPIRKKEAPKESGWQRDGRDYEIMMIDEDEGQKAVSEYRILDALARKYALVELKPLTGRTHQLRVHMQAIGCPIIGDHKYGCSTEAMQSLVIDDQLHLHARRVVIPAFGGGRAIDVHAPLPPHMKRSFKALGLDIPKK